MGGTSGLMSKRLVSGHSPSPAAQQETRRGWAGAPGWEELRAGGRGPPGGLTLPAPQYLLAQFGQSLRGEPPWPESSFRESLCR